MELKQIKYEGKVISYRSAGEGLPVVLLHGFGEDSAIWKNQLRLLEGYHVIVPDLPGTGGSEMIDDMSMEGIANMLERLLVHELATVFYKEGEPGSVVLIGHSMGGYISLAFAEKHPEMLRGLGLYHSSAYADTDEKKQTRRKGIEFIKKHGPYEFARTTIPNQYAEKAKSELPDEIRDHIAMAHNFSAEMLVSYLESMMKRPDRTNVLKQTKLPVFFLLGRHDPAVPMEDGLQQSHLPRTSYIHVLENSAHMGMIEQTEEANLHLLKYLELVKDIA